MSSSINDQAKLISQECAEDNDKVTGDVFGSLNKEGGDQCDDSDSKKRKSIGGGLKCCPKQLQLPMFLSKTYHMIDKCDSEVATWSDSGDNFVVKNVEKFAGTVLPLYFKHSNFSSFARQLNFYGFRKLRTDPILTSEVDPGTASYVRFYHENFQRDKPELLQQIKRATKGDQQSKDDLDTLRLEMAKLKASLHANASEYDRKLAELSYDCNRRISGMTAEYDKLVTLVTQTLGAHMQAAAAGATSTVAPVAAAPPAMVAALPAAATGAAAASTPLQIPVNADLLHSLSQAAVSLQDNARANLAAAGVAAGKRAAPAGGESGDAARVRVEEA